MRFLKSFIDFVELEKKYESNGHYLDILNALNVASPEFKRAHSLIVGDYANSGVYTASWPNLLIQQIKRINPSVVMTLREMMSNREVQLAVAEYILYHTEQWLDLNNKVTPTKSTIVKIYYGSFIFKQVAYDVYGTNGRWLRDCANYKFNIDGNNNLYKVELIGTSKGTIFALHFRDEDNPYPSWDSFWDSMRSIIYGRTEDIEKFEVISFYYSSSFQDEIHFKDTYSDGKTFAYVKKVAGIPFGYHSSATILLPPGTLIFPQPLYVSNTWNHMMDLSDDNPCLQILTMNPTIVYK